MSDTATTTAAPETEPVAIPEDFEEYNRWRETGELPTPEDPDASAPAQPEGKTAAEPETAPKQEPEKKEPTVPPNVQKRIDRAVKAQREAERKAADLETQLAQLRETPPAETLPKTAEPVAKTTAAEPKPEDFETYEEYVRAQARFEARQEVKAELAKLGEKQEKEDRETAQTSLIEAHNERVEEAKGRYADWDEVAETAKDLAVTPAMQAVLFESEHSADLLYHLATHPEEAAEIAALHPLGVARALGRLEAGFTKTAPKTSTKAVSKAPRPVIPINGSNAAATPGSIYDEKSAGDYNDWENRREAELKAKRKRAA